MKQSHNTIDYDKLLLVIEDTFLSPGFYWQSLSLLFCFVLSFVIYKVARRIILPQMTIALKRNIELNRVILKYALPLLYPLLAVIFLSIGLSIYAQFFKEVILFSTTLKLMTLFLFLRFLRISSGGNFIPNAVGLFLIPALVLDIFSLLDPTTNYLNQYALTIGTIRLSVYSIIKAFITLVLAFWFASMISKKSKNYFESKKAIRSSTKTIINKIIDILIYFVIVVVVLKTIGIDMTTFAVIGGALGVGIGFGLQKITSNFISGMILLTEKSVEVGDCIELDNGNVFGVVKKFSSRYTLVEGYDGKEIMIPNEELIASKFTNWTHSNNRARIQIDFGVVHGSDLELVQEIATYSAKQCERCLNYPEIECFVTQFADYDVKIRLYFWISDIHEGREPAKSAVMINLWKNLLVNGIEISVPRRDVRVV